MNLLRTHLRLLARRPGKASLLIGAMSAAAALEALTLLLLGPLLQQGAGHAGPAWFRLAGTGLVLAFLATGLLSAAARYASESLALSLKLAVEEDTRRETSQALMEMDWPSFLGLRLGDVSVAILNEGAHIGNASYQFLNAISSGLVVAVLGAAAFALSARMMAYTLAFGALGFLVHRALGRTAARSAERMTRETFEVGAETAATFGSLKFIRATGLGRQALGSLFRTFRRFADASLRSSLHAPTLRLLLEGGAVLMVSGFLLAGRLLAQGTGSQLLVFLLIFYRLAPRLLVLQDSLHQCRMLQVWHDGWKARLALAGSRKAPDGGSLPPAFQSSLRFEGVHFTYPGSDRPALSGLDLEIRQGECLALLGPSGSGKSTLLELATGLLAPTRGRILVDGQPLEALDRQAWQRSIGLVLQDSPLFHASVLDNIAWGAAPADPARAEAAARLAHAWDFIESLPGGLDSRVGERGGRLSGGQRQRIALARALYRQPSLLLLDEATSALDPGSEREILRALERIKGGCTLLMATHRLSMAQVADRILILEAGCPPRPCTWEELSLDRPRWMESDPPAPGPAPFS